jgi:hypothetical protein
MRCFEAGSNTSEIGVPSGGPLRHGRMDTDSPVATHLVERARTPFPSGIR